MAERPPLHDYSRSRAVVMGTSDYDFLQPIPAARNSLDRMASLLTGPLCGWPTGRLTILANTPSRGDIADMLITAFEDVTDVALFYYVGHGQIDFNDQLCLGLVGSRPEANRRASTSLQFGEVRTALLDSPATTKIVILDCCFAALANRPSNTLAAVANSVMDKASDTGAYTMAASSPYATAWYESDPSIAKPQTFFTRYFADLIETGIPGQPSGLRLHPIFLRLRDNLVRDQRPTPHERSVDAARDFVFSHNASPPETHSDPVVELQRVRQQMADAEARLAVAEVRRLEAEARERQLRERLVDDELRSLQPIDAEQKQQLQYDLHEAEREIDRAATAQAEAEAALHDVAARVLEYSTDKGPAELAANPPAFADETYRQLARAAVLAKNPQAILRLIDISRQQQHVEGEACWLAFAHRLHIPGTALALGQVHGGAGLDEHMRVLTITAFLEGDDDAAREVLTYPSDILKRILVKSFPQKTLEDVLETAAKMGSLVAQYELGLAAVKAKKYDRSVQFLKGPAAAGNANASYLLGTSLLIMKQRREGRGWLRKAGTAGNYYARLEFARTSRRRRPIRALARESIIDLDAGRIEGYATDQVDLMMRLADYCLKRRSTAEAIACLRRAASHGSNAAMIRLGQLHTDLGEPQAASQWLEQALPGWIPNKDLEALLFRLACLLSWKGDNQGSRRWFTIVADMGNAQAAEIVAEVRDVPAKPRWHPPSLRPMLDASWRRLAFASDVTARIVSRFARFITATAGARIVTATAGALTLLFGLFVLVNSLARSSLGFHTFAGAVYTVAGVVIISLGILIFTFRR